MTNMLQEFIDEGWLLVYMDDILIYSEDNLELHHARTRKVLQQLQQNDLYLKPSKCFFDQTTIEYLGLMISRDIVSMDQVKVTGITAWETPKHLHNM